MFNIFKKKEKENSEYEKFRHSLNSDYSYFYKIYFPIEVYPDLPSEPIIGNWQERQLFILENLVPSSFKEKFEKEYSQIKGERFEIIQKGNKVEINTSKIFLLVQEWLGTQRKVYKSRKELDASKHKLRDFNVYLQILDYTPKEILTPTLEAISIQFNHSISKIERFTGEEIELPINKLLEKIDYLEPYYHLDKLYNIDGNWQLVQPEESTFLLIGSNAKELHDLLDKANLEIEVLKNSS